MEIDRVESEEIESESESEIEEINENITGIYLLLILSRLLINILYRYRLYSNARDRDCKLI